LDHGPVDRLARLRGALDGTPGLLEARTLLGQDQPPVLVLLGEDERVDLLAERDLVVGVDRLADRQLVGGDYALGLVADVDEDLCGASFAGLAAARELAGSGARTLVLDRYEIGERQTSACAAPTRWLRYLGLESSLRQTFVELVVHTPYTTVRYPLPFTFST